jgi:hypothetical protein
MDFRRACNILGLDKSNISSSTVRRAFLRRALETHPDRGGKKEDFIAVHDANTFLNQWISSDAEEPQGEEDLTYVSLMRRFISVSTGIQVPDESILAFLEKVSSGCQKVAIEAVRRMDREPAVKVLEYISKYGEVVGVSEDTRRDIREIVDQKTRQVHQTIDHVVLEPTLEDMMGDLVYKLEMNGETYCVPLWHEEVIFDLESGKELRVTMAPSLPEGTWIDSDNSIRTSVRLEASRVIEDGYARVALGGKVFDISAAELKLVPRQTAVLAEKGILQYSVDDPLSATKRGAIIIDVCLT